MPFVGAASALHAQASLQTSNTVRGNAVNFAVAASCFIFGTALSYAEFLAIGILARQVEQVDTSKNCEEAAKEGDRVACVDGWVPAWMVCGLL